MTTSLFDTLPAELMSKICQDLRPIDRYHLEDALGHGLKIRIVPQEELARAEEDEKHYWKEEELYNHFLDLAEQVDDFQLYDPYEDDFDLDDHFDDF